MKIRTARRAVAAIVLAALTTGASFQPAEAAGTLLRYHWVAGQTFSLLDVQSTVSTLNATAKGSTGPAIPIVQSNVDSSHFKVTFTIIKVLKNGTGVVHITFSAGSFTSNGKTISPNLKPYSITENVDPIGVTTKQIVSGSSKIPSVALSALSKPQALQYPGGPVSVGDNWKISSSSSDMAQYGLSSITLRAKLDSLSTVGSRQTASVTATFNVPLNAKLPQFNLVGGFSGSERVTFFVDTGAPTRSARVGHFVGNISGVSQGEKITGNFNVTINETQTAA